MTMDPTHKATRSWFRDADYYVGWYVFWGVLFSLVLPVMGRRGEAAGYWTTKVHHALFGVGFGLVCALAFTILQNGFNRSRTKSISWIFAIGSWAVLSMLVALVTGFFG